MFFLLILIIDLWCVGSASKSLYYFKSLVYHTISCSYLKHNYYNLLNIPAVSRPTAQGGKIGISAKIGVGGYTRDGLLYTFTMMWCDPTLRTVSYEIIHISCLKELTTRLIIMKRGITFSAIAVSAILPTRNSAFSDHGCRTVMRLTEVWDCAWGDKWRILRPYLRFTNPWRLAI